MQLCGDVYMDGRLRNMTSIYLFKGGKVLLLYRQGGRVVNNVWTGSAGGHFEKNELNDAKACVLRELNEELGLQPENIDGLTLRYITLRRTKGEIRQNYYFFAELKESVDDNLISNEGSCRWFTLEEISTLEMPFTAKYVMEHYCRTGYLTNALYVGIASPDKVYFSGLQEF